MRVNLVIGASFVQPPGDPRVRDWASTTDRPRTFDGLPNLFPVVWWGGPRPGKSRRERNRRPTSWWKQPRRPWKEKLIKVRNEEGAKVGDILEWMESTGSNKVEASRSYENGLQQYQHYSALLMRHTTYFTSEYLRKICNIIFFILYCQLGEWQDKMKERLKLKLASYLFF